jgi:hypothetical protein|tara:strand:- start:24 stop:176 length:153 start_codon:yes stop_codon:yes gene_type:complete
MLTGKRRRQDRDPIGRFSDHLTQSNGLAHLVGDVEVMIFPASVETKKGST